MAEPLPLPSPLEWAAQAFDFADYGRCLALVRPVFEAADTVPVERSRAACLLVRCLHRRGEAADVMAVLEAARACAEAAGDADSAFEIVRLASLACGESRRFDDALRLARELGALAGTDPQRQVLITLTQAACFERMGDPWQALRLLDPLPALVHDMAAPPLLMRVLHGMASSLIAMHHVLRDAGDLGESRRVLAQAMTHAADALPIVERTGDVWLTVVAGSLLADAQLRAGELDAAQLTLSAALAQAELHELQHLMWRLRCIGAEIRLAQGDAATARAEVELILAALPAQQVASPLLRLHHVAYRAYVAQGDVVRALAHLEAYLALERKRTAEQLQAQSRELVSRVEVENAVRQAERASGEAREHRRRADALADVAMKDALTGTLNRRGLEERIAGFQRLPNQLAVAMVDLDFFKLVNDTWGHAVGDQVLAQVGAVLREAVRPRDVVARYGGEEFVLLLAGLGSEEAFDVCERLRERLASLTWQTIAPGLRLTISIGLSLSPEASDASVDVNALLLDADAALYRAKALGRNRVELAV